MRPDIRLYQFPVSHFCEKTRWALDYKGLTYQLINLLPGPHILTTKRLAKRSSVPILDYRGTILQDSTVILEFLEDAVPSPPLIPKQADEKKEALEWEEYCDAEVGPHLRRFFYHHLLDEPKLMPKLLLEQGAWYGPYLFFFAFPAVKRLMRKSMNIYPEPVKKSAKILDAALHKLDRAVTQRDFLVGKHFSRADLGAAALLAPLFTPREHDYPWPQASSLPEPIQELMARWEDSALQRWVHRMYRDFRKKGAARG